MRLIILGLLLFLLHCGVKAQQREYIFKNFTMEDGLPSNETYYIFEDSRHFLWIATDLGVARFDGIRFQTFDLPDNVVFKIKEDRKGRIWFFSHRGLLAYFENEKVYPYQYNAAVRQRVEKMHIVDAWIDDADNIHLSSLLDSNFIFHHDGKISAHNHNRWGELTNKFNIIFTDSKNCFTDRYLSSHSAGDSLILAVKKESRTTTYRFALNFTAFGHFGAVTNDKGDVYFFGEKYIIKLRPDGSSSIKTLNKNILSLYYHSGSLWAGLRKGGSITLDEDLSILNYGILSGKTVSSSCLDYEGGIWLSTTENGIYYTRNPNIRNLVLNDSNPAIDRLLNINDSILIYTDLTGLHSVINNKSAPLLKLDNARVVDMHILDKKKLMVFGSFGSNEPLIKRSPNRLFNPFYLVPTMSEGALINKDSVVFSSSSYTSGCVKIYSNDHGARLWAFYKENVQKDGSPKKRSLNKPSRLFFDQDQKNLWFASNDGLYKSRPPYESNNITRIPGSIFEYGVSCIRKLDNGWMAAGIRLKGIVLFKDSGSPHHITESDGLLSNKIKFILPIHNQLWVATAKGVSVIIFSSFNPVTYQIVNIGKNDGFYNVTINQLIEYKKEIVAATSNGIYFIENPTAFLEKKLAPIPFYINSISYYKGDTTGIHSVTLPYSNSRLVLKYSAVSYNAGEKLQYQYRFDQGDTIWRSTTNTERLVENLAPGTYSLQLKAAIPEQNRYSDIKTFTITIEKPWWQNNWFRLMAVLVSGTIIYYIISKRVQKIKKEEERKTALNTRLTELEQTALRSQMNPHFIFNCLTSIQQLIISGNKLDANEYLVKFSRLIRTTLDLSAQPFIAVREEKEYLEEYLSLEQLRLSGKFEFYITADPSLETDKIFIPNMMLQPIVENCVRHGIKPLENRMGSITIHFIMGKNAVTCTVTDNGVGRHNFSSFNEKVITKHKSYGMDIVRKRLETFSEFNVDESRMEIRDLIDINGDPSGTEVTLQLPYKNTI